ncbi:IS3 family transposase [Streptomyces sp. NPDC059786]|uniref:IS3 family transposase n=1 Tax=Streptomyces sp. NPDC059786 TaxID=3346946 RepID=UPI003658D25F
MNVAEKVTTVRPRSPSAIAIRGPSATSTLADRRPGAAGAGARGHRRIHAQLHRWGVAAGLELVRRLMRELGLEARQPKPKRFGLTRHTPGPVPDLVGRNFTAEAPGEKLVADYDKDFRGRVHSDAERLEQLRGGSVHQVIDHLRQLFGLGVEILPPLGERAQGVT